MNNYSDLQSHLADPGLLQEARDVSLLCKLRKLAWGKGFRLYQKNISSTPCQTQRLLLL